MKLDKWMIRILAFSLGGPLFGFILLILILLTGCATTKGPEVVKVPVSVPCIDPTDVPAQPKLTFEHDPWVDGKTAAKRLLIDYYNLQAYATRLEILVTGCTSK